MSEIRKERPSPESARIELRLMFARPIDEIVRLARQATAKLQGALPVTLFARARFVVGTGRCGSTLLSRMLALNGDVLSLFEFFSGIDEFFRFRTDLVGGNDLADRLLEDHPALTWVLERGYEVPEVAYPFDSPDARYGRADPIPWTLAIAVARLSDEPDVLFDEIISFARTLPEQLLSTHYRQLLEWLTRRCEKSLWIERSGNTLGLVPELKGFFPDARFVHLHRNGLETALSMREYSVLRLAVPLMYSELGEFEYSRASSRSKRTTVRRSMKSSRHGRRSNSTVDTGASSSNAACPPSTKSIKPTCSTYASRTS